MPLRNVFRAARWPATLARRWRDEESTGQPPAIRLRRAGEFRKGPAGRVPGGGRQRARLAGATRRGPRAKGPYRLRAAMCGEGRRVVVFADPRARSASAHEFDGQAVRGGPAAGRRERVGGIQRRMPRENWETTRERIETWHRPRRATIRRGERGKAKWGVRCGEDDRRTVRAEGCRSVEHMGCANCAHMPQERCTREERESVGAMSNAVHTGYVWEEGG